MIVWALRATWALLPVVAGPALDAALTGRSRPVQLTASIGLWLAWAVGLVTTLVPTAVALTAIRLLAPGALGAAAWAWVAGASSGRSALAVAGACVAGVLASGAEVGRVFVQGSAYGDEARFPLRPPVWLLAVLPVLWAVTAAGVVAGPMLLAAHQWIAGAVAIAAGWPVAVFLARRLHRLSRRWVVVVPAGIVVHDDMALAETLLLRRPQVRLVTLAPAGTEATDLTVGAVGMAVEIDLTEAVALAPARDRLQARPRPVPTVALLVSPSRPGAVLEECALRRFPVGAQ